MPPDKVNELTTKIDDMSVVVDEIKTALIGDLKNKGYISKLDETTTKVEENTDDIKTLQDEGKSKTKKELAVTVSIIIMLIGLVFNLLK